MTSPDPSTGPDAGLTEAGDTALTRARTAATLDGHAASAAAAAAWAFPSFGRYRQLRPIDAGGMGQVFEVFDPDSNQSVALKTWQKEDPRLRASLAKEFHTLATLRHENLIRLFELSLTEPCPYFTMELIRGRDLLQWVRPAEGAGPAGFHEDRLRDALRQLAAGLNYLHAKKLLHRDIKPSNIMVTHEGTLKLLDFGVAVSLDRDGVYAPTVAGSTAGTEKYMSPQQAVGGNLAPADDWYSVGLVLFECLTGQFPFPSQNSVVLHEAKKAAEHGVSPQSRQAAVPDDLDRLCRELLVTDPERRPTGAEVLRRLGAAAEATPAAPRSRLLGRSDELDALRRALGNVLQTQRPQLVLIHGNSGIGKSELAGRFLDEAAELGGVRVFRGRCYEYVFAAYRAFDELLTDICRYLRRLSDLERQAVLPSDIRALRAAFPVFGDQGVVSAPATATLHSSPQERRQQGFAALRELLMRMGPSGARQGPLPLLFLDDLQWGDLDSLALLIELMRAPGAPPCLVVGSYRNEDALTSPFLLALRDAAAGEQSAWSSPPQFVEVCPLSMEQGAELAGELLAGEEGVTRELKSLIARQSRGNPLFVYELARSWQARTDERLSGELNLDTLLQQRVAALPAALRRLVQLVALAGRPVPARELLRAAGLESHNPAWVQDLKDARLLRSVGATDHSRLDTFHDRVRESVVAALDPASRRELHERWVAALVPHVVKAPAVVPQPAGPPGPPIPPATSSGSSSLAGSSPSSASAEYEFVAQQLLGAQRPVEAAHFLRLEADQAAATFAFARAAELYRLALANHGGSAEDARAMRAALAECLANIGHCSEAASEYLAAAEGAPADEALALRSRAAQCHLTSGHVTEGLAVLRQVLGMVGLRWPKTPVGALASILWRRSLLAIRGLKFSPRAADTIGPAQRQRLDACWSAVAGLSLVDPIRAADFVGRFLWLSLQAGDPARVALALATHSGHVAIAGPAAAKSVEKLLVAARDAARQAPGDYGWGAAALAEGIAAHLQGRWTATIENCDKAETLFRTCGTHDVAWEIETSQMFAMWALMYRGDMTEMARRQSRLMIQAIERDDLYARLNFGTTVMAHLNLAAGKVAAAREQLAADEALLLPDCYHVQHHNALLARALVELYDGQPAAAWRAVENGWPRYTRSLLGRIQQVRIDFLQVYGRAAVAALAVDPTSATLRKAAADATRRLRREQNPWATALADVVEAGSLLCDRRPAEAKATLTTAIKGLDDVEMHLFALAGRRQLAALENPPANAGVQSADDAFRASGVNDPPRMAYALIPFVAAPQRSS